MRWIVEALPVAWREIDALPTGLRARLLRLMQLIEVHGLEHLHEPHAKYLEGKLWELRAKASEGIARGLYVTVTGRRVVVLHAFVKRTTKTPPGALAIARERMKEIDP